jgi:hypothetical protein
LTHFQISGSNMVGNIPSWVANFTLLRILELGHSSFVGDIPDVFGRLPHCKGLIWKNIISQVPSQLVS